MPEEVKVVDVAVRLTCRFSNGLTQSVIARGIAMKDRVLRVQVREKYEAGVQLSVIAPFLSRITPAHVTAFGRGAEPGTFLVDLTLKDFMEPAVTATGTVVEFSAASLKETARALAGRLQGAGRLPYQKAAFAGVPLAERPRMLAVTELAVIALLEEKGLASRSLLTMGEASR